MSSLHACGAWFLWLLIGVYSILGAIDFGSSYWRWHFHLKGQSTAEAMAATYLSPTWELINTFLIVIPVGLVGLFPRAAGVYGTILCIPATLLLLLLALRGAFMQFGYASKRFQKQGIFVAGLTGLFIPGVFSMLLPLSQGGYVTIGGGQYILHLGRLFGSLPVYLFLAFGITLSLYLSSIFLAHYAQRAEQWEAHHQFVRGAVWTGPVSLLLGALSLLLPSHDGFSIMVNGLRYPIFGSLMTLSLIAWVLGYASVRRQYHQPVNSRRSLWQLGWGLAQVVSSLAAYAIAHAPYLLYPYLTINQSASNHSMFLATLLVLILGLLILSPVLLWFHRLFIRDRQYISAHSNHS